MLMPEGIVAATYNIVVNETPIYLDHNYNYKINNVYFTELSHREGTLKVMIDNAEVAYRDIDTQFRRFEVRERNKRGYIRFSYTPREYDDYLGDENYDLNSLRTRLIRKYIPLDVGIINQMRMAISQIQSEVGLLQDRWIGGRFTDTYDVVTGDSNNPITITSNLIAGQTLFNKVVFEEIIDSIYAVANYLGHSISEYGEDLVVDPETIDAKWIETVRQVINEMEGIV